MESLLSDFSLEMTGKDVGKLAEARDRIPPGTRINVTFLEHEDPVLRLDAARAARRSGFVPVPHISARRLRSQALFEEYLTGLAKADATESVLVIAGDPAVPLGPYEDALALIRSGLLQRYGVRDVGVSGYPEGHPAIPDAVLWSALQDKAAALADLGLSGSVITQFGFDVDPVLSWIEAVRERGILLPIRVGVPGPAGVRRLLTYATRFGVGTSAGIAKKYGFSITNLMGTTGPDRFIRALTGAYDPRRHGVVKLHFYTFGGLKATSDWVAEFRQKESASRLRGDSERDAVIAFALARENARRVVVDIGIGVRLGPLEYRRVVHGPLGGITRRPGRPRAAAAVLIGAEPGARGLAGDDGAAHLDGQHARAVNGFGAPSRHASVRADLVFRAALHDVDVHGEVGPVDHGHVVEVEAVPGVHVVFGQRRGDRAVAGALEPAAAVARRAVPGAAVEHAPCPAPEPAVPAVGNGDGHNPPRGKHPAGGRQRLAGIG
jgi:methylenetetrahydrofolate reductase (NADPH)